MQLKCVAALVAVLLAASTSQVRGQATDGDDQFEVVHQDIARTSAATPAVAADSVLRQLPQQQTRTSSQVQQQLRPTQPQTATNARRKATRTRVTYAVKPHADDDSVRSQSAPVLETPAVLQPVQTGQQAPLLHQAPRRQSTRHQQVLIAAAPAPLVTQAPLESAVAAHQHHQHHQRHAAATFSPEATLEAAAVPAFGNNFAHSNLQPQLASASQQLAALPVRPAASSAQLVDTLGSQEPQIEPSFDSVVSGGCPSLGVFSWPNKDLCDRYYMCTNGTFTEEACPNGLGYSKLGAVYQHCAYHWNVDCGTKKAPGPVSSPGCPWQFGIFAVEGARCSINYNVCEWGLPEVRSCKDGLFYDDRIKGCQWADQLGCKSEPLLQFKCPQNDEDNAYYPFPRYYHSPSDIIVCVSDTPRLVHCNEDQFVDPASLACLEKNPKKKKKLLTRI